MHANRCIAAGPRWHRHRDRGKVIGTEGTELELGTKRQSDAHARGDLDDLPVLGAAGSLREGLAETLTVNGLGVPPTLARSLRSTNPVESMIEICRDHSSNVKRWQDGTMALRWCAAGMREAAKQFRRVNGHRHLAALRVALNTHFETTVSLCNDEEAA